MPRSRRAPRWQSYSLLLLNTLIWGAALVVVKPALETTTPFRFLMYRFLLAGVLTIPLLVHYWPKVKKPFQAVKIITLIELVGTTLGLGCLYVGLQNTTAIEASLLTTTSPLFVIIAGLIWLKEKQELPEWIGMSLAVIGTGVLSFYPIWKEGISGLQLSSQGTIFLLFYLLINAWYFILAKRHFSHLPKFFATSVGFWVGFITFAVLSIGETPSVPALLSTVRADSLDSSVVLASGYMAILGSVIGLTAYIKGQDGVEASEASLFWYLQPLIYIPMGIWWLKETVQPFQLVALFLIIAGVLVAQLRSTRHHIT